MKDGLLRRGIKALARQVQRVDLGLGRLALRLQGEPRYQLGGRCVSCGACCERPTVELPRPLFHLRSYRWLLVRWHRWINGFALEQAHRRSHTLVFRCTHFDPATRGCDSYGSRPLMCRDYPRALLYHHPPVFFESCAQRVVYRFAAELDRALLEQDLPPETLAQLCQRLHLEE